MQQRIPGLTHVMLLFASGGRGRGPYPSSPNQYRRVLLTPREVIVAPGKPVDLVDGPGAAGVHQAAQDLDGDPPLLVECPLAVPQRLPARVVDLAAEARRLAMFIVYETSDGIDVLDVEGEETVEGRPQSLAVVEPEGSPCRISPFL